MTPCGSITVTWPRLRIVSGLGIECSLRIGSQLGVLEGAPSWFVLKEIAQSVTAQHMKLLFQVLGARKFSTLGGAFGVPGF